MKKPRRLFRARKVGSALYVGRDPLPAIRAWVEQNRHRARPGTLAEVEVWHDADCPYPRTNTLCTCRTGPEIRFKGEDPESN